MKSFPWYLTTEKIHTSSIQSCSAVLGCVCRRYLIATSLARAAEIQAQVRVVKQQPPAVLASLLDSLFSPQVGNSCCSRTHRVPWLVAAVQNRLMGVMHCRR